MSKRWEFSKRLLLKDIPRVKNPIWVHTASVGEFNTALPIIRELKKEHSILLTYSSPRAREYLRSFSEEYDSLYPLPLDIPFLIKRFEERINPEALIILERELWPSLIMFTKTKKILINAYARGSLLERMLLKYFSLIVARTEEDAKLFKRLGAKRVMRCGNLKLVHEYTPKRLNIPEGRYIVAGSTHEGEEEIILRAFKELKLKDYKLIIVPRHIERAGKVKELSERFRFNTSLYSKLSGDWEVLIVDKLGLLRDIYPYGRVAIVGGTFVPVGGHNLLEPAYYSLPVVFGRYTQKVEDLKRILFNLGLGFQVKEPEKLKDVLRFLISKINPPHVDLRKLGRDVKECYLKAIKSIISQT